MKKIFIIIVSALSFLNPVMAKKGLFSSLFLGILAEEALAKEGDVAEVDKIIAVVDDEVITKSEINAVLFSIYEEYKKNYSGQQLVQKMDQVRQNVLAQMIEEKLILNAAKETDIEITDEQIDEKIEELKKKFNSEEDFVSALQKQGVNLRDLRERFKKEILKTKLIEQEVKFGITVSLGEISDYYHSHSDEFNKPEKVKVSAILIKPEGDERQDWLDALDKVSEILYKLDHNAVFEDLAKEYSQGLNVEKGGDMGFISRGHMLKEIDDVMFNLKIEQVSSPVKTKSGCYIFKLRDKQPGSVIELEDAQYQIRGVIFMEKFNIKFKKWLEDLKKDAYISIK